MPLAQQNHPLPTPRRTDDIHASPVRAGSDSTITIHRSAQFAPAPAPAASIFRFSDCELCVDKRELTRLGIVQRVQPKVFDLLLYLIEHRERVVTRDELLRNVWKNAYVSESVIGRCIMKARRAIADSDPNAQLIRTLPRAGYRFASKVHASQRSASTTPSTVDFTQRRVATLPWTNATGNNDLVWVELGMATLLGRVLRDQTKFTVASINDVLAALDAASTNPPEQLAAMVARVTGAEMVVAVELTAPEAGFALTYRVIGGNAPMHGQLLGEDITRLTVELGVLLSREFERIRCAGPSPSSDLDAFVQEAYARASRAGKAQQYQVALDHLKVCVAADSPPIEIQVEYVCALAAIEHPDTPDTARRVHELAVQAHRPLLQARLLTALSIYHQASGDLDLAHRLIHEALSQVEHGSDDMAAAAVLLQRAELAIATRDFNVAASLGQRVLAVARAGNEPSLVAECLRQEGTILHLRGDLARGLEVLERAATVSREPALHHAGLARILQRVARIHRDAGRLQAAIDAIDTAAELSEKTGAAGEFATILIDRLALHADAGHRVVTEEARSQLRLPQIQRSRAGRFLLQVAEAEANWRVGRIDEALRSMTIANAKKQALRDHWLTTAIGTHTGIAIAAGRYDLARELIAEMESHRHFYEGTCLQGMAEFHRAALSHAQGDRLETWRLLRESMELSAPGKVKAAACLAAAWLACEDGTEGLASTWLDELPGWTQEHPHGLIALARHRYEQGAWAEAVALQARYVDGWPSDEIPRVHRQFLQAYREAEVSRRKSRLPRLQHLLTLRA